MDPPVQVRENPWGLRQFEVLLPAGQILSQFSRDLGEAPSAAPAGDLPDALLQLVKGLGGTQRRITPPGATQKL